MMRKLFYLIILFSFPNLSFATGDSTRFLTAKDTIFLSINGYQEKVFEHVLEKGQTLYSLARFYGLKLDEVYAYNPRLHKEGYKPGDAVQIPVPNRAILRYKNSSFRVWNYVPVYYKVKKGDTFYGISKRYFKMPIDTIIQRNNLPPDIELSRDQKLHIGWMSRHGIPDSLRQIRGGPLWEKSYSMKNVYFLKKSAKREYKQSGAAYWNQEKGASNDLYALHPYAPIGSIISIKSPLYNRTVYVKVIGRMPLRAYDREETKVIVSQAVAKMLGARDPRFFVEIQYLK